MSMLATLAMRVSGTLGEAAIFVLSACLRHHEELCHTVSGHDLQSGNYENWVIMTCGEARTGFQWEGQVPASVVIWAGSLFPIHGVHHTPETGLFPGGIG